MLERAHPDDPGFQDRRIFRWRWGFIQWWGLERSPYRAELLRRYAWARQYIAGRDALDVPCGMGWGTSLLTGGRSLRGIDRNLEAVKEATRRYGHTAHFHVGDMAQLAYRDSSFDVVVCLEGIEHV